MAYEQRDDSGTLFRIRDRRHDDDRHSSGSAKVAGTDFWLDAWAEEDIHKDNKQLRIRLKEKASRNEAGEATIREEDREGKSENYPDYKGRAKIGDVDYWVSAWIKEARTSGNKFLSLSFQIVERRDAPTSDQAGQAGSVQRDSYAAPASQFDEDLPF